MNNSEAVVQRQLEAYNARDLQRFMAEYSDDICMLRMREPTPALQGRSAVAKFYATERFSRPALHAEIINRMVLGNKVVDHERITGVTEQPFEVVVVYEVIDGLIRRTWAYAPA